MRLIVASTGQCVSIDVLHEEVAAAGAWSFMTMVSFWVLYTRKVHSCVKNINSYNYIDIDDNLKIPVPKHEDAQQKEQFDITGMTCSACSARVDKAVAAVDGVKNVSVNLLKTR